MIQNYFKTAWRNLVKNKVSSFINIGGLTAGMAVAILIGLWITDELSFNKYHQNYDDIGQVMVHNGYDDQHGTYTLLPMPLGKELRSFFSDDFKYFVLSTGTGQHTIASKDKKFTQSGNFMQPEAPEMLTLKMLYGSDKGLADPGSILLTESLSRKLFGDADPINEIVKIDNKLNVKVTGVYEYLPDNSIFKTLSFIAPWDLFICARSSS